MPDDTDIIYIKLFLIFWPSTCHEKLIQISKIIISNIFIYMRVNVRCEMNGDAYWIIKHENTFMYN